MKNIAIIVQNLHNGGAERMAANMSLELSKYANVYLCVFDSSDAIYEYGGKLVDLHTPPVTNGGIMKRILNTINRARRLRYEKKLNHIDVAISHMGGANLANILSRKKERVISVYHSMPSREFTADPVNRLAQQFIAGHSYRYVCVSKPALKDMHESFGVDEEKLTTIYNFVDVRRIREMGGEGLSPDTEAFFTRHEHVMVHAGRLTALKAQHRLLLVLSSLRDRGMDAGLVILGDGEERAELEEKAAKWGLTEHVLFTGEIKNPFPYIKYSDVFVLCSKYEGLPMVIIEALALRCPVVSIDMMSGAREILAPDTDISVSAKGIEYAEYGILTPQYRDDKTGQEEDQECLTEAVYQMMTDENLRRNYIGRCDEAVRRFTPDAIIGQWKELAEL